jgi:NADPH:quinone reductase-like Zn-dependent oxidoreductase
MIYGSPHSYRGLVAGRSLSHSPLAANEVVVRVRAIAVNPIDAMPGFLYRVIVYRVIVRVQHMVSAIPDSLPFQQAGVLPLALSTAATGMFQQDHLGLAMPSADPVDRSDTVLVLGASTSAAM